MKIASAKETFVQALCLRDKMGKKPEDQQSIKIIKNQLTITIIKTSSCSRKYKHYFFIERLCIINRKTE